MSENGKEPTSAPTQDDGAAQAEDGGQGEGAGEGKAQPASADASAAAPPSPEALLEQVRQEKKEIYDRLLRTAADFDNFKKRSRKEAGEAEDRGRTRFIKEILPVLDNLERALAHDAAQGGASVVEGVRMVLRQLQGALEKFEVKPIEAQGKPFDPSVHEAIQQFETDEHPAGTVTAEVQKGYALGGKLLRPALVVVATPRGAARPEGSADSTDGTPSPTSTSSESH
jgi:molecular chaperone GrpE